MICLVLGILPVQASPSVLGNLKQNGIDMRGSTTAKDVDSGEMALLVSIVVNEATLPSTSAENHFVEYLSNIEGVTSCEVWVSAPAPLQLKPSIIDSDGGGYPIGFRPDTVDSARILKEWGMLVQSNALDATAVLELRTIVDDAIAHVDEQLRQHHPSITIGEDNFLFREIASRSRHRFDLRLYNADDFVERHILGQKPIHALLSHMFDDEPFDFDVSVVYSRPGAETQGWHSDGNHAPVSEDAGWDAQGWESKLSDPYAICLFVPLIDLDHATGYTQFWPASHRSKHWAGFGQVAAVTESTYDGIGKAGDAIWYDYRTWHRGMPNTSNDIRPVVQVIFKRTWYVERANYGTEPIVPC